MEPHGRILKPLIPALAALTLGFAALSALRQPGATDEVRPEVAVRSAGFGPADAVEIVSARAWNTKAFRQADGRRRYIVSSGPLHYRDEDGWQDIDTTIRPSETGDADYEMSRSIYRAFFRERFDAGPVVRMEKNGHAIAVTPGPLYWTNRAGTRQLIAEPRAVTGRAAGNVITYANAYGAGLDFVYEAADIRLSKRLIIPSFSALPRPGTDILDGDDPALGLNIAFEIDDDVEIFVEGRAWDRRPQDIAGRLEFRKNGELLWYFAPPRAWDASGADIGGCTRLRADADRLHLAITFSLNWLHDTNGAITLDPDTYYGETTDTNITGENNSYATARATSTTINTGSGILQVGQEELVNYFVYRSVVEFDTSAISDTVNQANLYLKLKSDKTASADCTVRVHKYDWSSPVTAGNQEANYDGALASTYDADWRSSAGIAVDVYYASQNLDTSWVDTAGTTRYALLSDRDVSATDPGIGGGELLQMYSHNDATQSNRPYLEIVTNFTPDAPSTLGPTAYVLGGCGTDTTPTLQFTQSDSDGGDTLAFQVQIDDSSDFASAVVDYQSASLAQGATSFTVGQAAGGGSYTTGSEGQTLATAGYYWRVRSYDGTSWGNWSTANGGSVAFSIAGTCPLTVGPAGPTECGGSGCDYNAIQTAIDAAGPGSAITVYRRTDDAANNECYDEHITIGVANLTLQGSSTVPASAACIGPSTGGHMVTITADGVTLQDLHVSGRVNDGAGGTNSVGSGGRAYGHGIFITGHDVNGVTIENCSVDNTFGDNIRFQGDQDGDGDGYIVLKQCYLHHSDNLRNLRIMGGGGSAGDEHIVRNCLMHTGHGILVSKPVEYITIEHNVIKGWPFWGHLGGLYPDYPETRDGSHGGGWRYYSNCAVGIWINDTDPTNVTIQNNLIVAPRIGIRVGTTGTIRNNTIVNPFNTAQYDSAGTIQASDIRDETFGIMLTTGFAGTIQNNVIAVTADNRADGQAGQATAPYYTPGITGYGIAFQDNTGSLGGGASITNNNVWGFVDTDGTSPLNYGSGITTGDTNLSVDPQFASDDVDETNGGSAPCPADGNDGGDVRCYELYEDNYFLASSGSGGSCHAETIENVAGAPEYVDLSSAGANDPDSDFLSGLGDCSFAADSAESRCIDFGTGAVASETEKNGDAPNLGAFGGTDRASTSPTLRIAAVDVGDGGVRNGDSSAQLPGVVQPRSAGLTEVNVYFNRAVSASSSSFVIRDYCDTQNLTAPTSVDTSGASSPPYKVTLTWNSSTFNDQAVRVHVLGDGVDRIVDNEDGDDLDGEITGLDSGPLPSGNGTDGGDAAFAVHAVAGDADGDGKVEGVSGEHDYDAVTGFSGYPAGSCSGCPEDFDGDGDVDATDLAVVTGNDLDAALGCTLFSDDFNRSDDTDIGGSWTETEQGPATSSQILSNRLDFESAGVTNKPQVDHTFTTQTAGTIVWTFVFNVERTGSDTTYNVRMQLGDSALMVNPTVSEHTGVAVNLIWGSPDQGLTSHEGLGYDNGGSVTEVAVVSGDAGSNSGGDATIRVVADLDANTFDLLVSGTGLISGSGRASGVAFDNNVDIDAVRIYLDDVDDDEFGDLEIDDVVISEAP